MLIISVGRQWNDNGVPSPYWLAKGLACAGLDLLLGVATPAGRARLWLNEEMPRRRREGCGFRRQGVL